MNSLNIMKTYPLSTFSLTQDFTGRCRADLLFKFSYSASVHLSRDQIFARVSHIYFLVVTILDVSSSLTLTR